MTRLALSLAAWLWMLTLATALQAAPRSFHGVVTHVGDGDTLWVKPARGAAPVQLRLQGIDAPEICQAWGRRRAPPCRARCCTSR